MTEQQTPAVGYSGRRWNWGWSITAVYTVFALATIGFAAFSFTQKVELVTPDYYERELRYDEHARRIHNATLLTEPVRITVNRQSGMLELLFPLNASSGTVLLYRPSASGLDRSYSVACDANNAMHINVQSLTRGEWHVQVTWNSNATPLYHESVVHL